MTPRLFVDTAVFAYAIGAPHPQRESCRALVDAAGRGEVELHICAEAVQELLSHRMRRTDRVSAADQARAVLDLCVVHPVDDEVLLRALDLVTRSSLRGRDAIHAATAIEAGFVRIVSPDADFDGVPDLVRVGPAEVP